MNEVKIGSQLREFPGATFNEVIRRIKRLEGNQQPRRGGGGGGGGGMQVCLVDTTGVTTAYDAPDPGFLDGAFYDVLLGSANSSTLLNYAAVEIDSGSRLVAVKIGTDWVIIAAFCG